MVYVKLEKPWTDGDGIGHAAGEMVDVDAATLAKMQEAGVVTEWIGPTSDQPSAATTGGGKP